MAAMRWPVCSTSFLKHKFRGLEIGGSIGNTNLGASSDARELETWMIAGTGDDKTDIVIIADAYDRAAIYGRDRNITSNANQDAWGGFDNRSFDFPGVIGQLLSNPEAPLGFRLIPKLFFSGNSPPPHSATNVSTSPYYINKVPYPDRKLHVVITRRLRPHRFQRRIAKVSMALSRTKFVTIT